MVEFFCTICHESYGSSDEIYSTRCGHVFHHRCITDWLTRSATCSECRAACSSSDIKKLFMIPRDLADQSTDVDFNEENSKLKAQLEQSIKTLSEVQHTLDETEKNLAELQIQLDSAAMDRDDLKSKLEEMKVLNKSLEIELDSKGKISSVSEKLRNIYYH